MEVTDLALDASRAGILASIIDRADTSTVGFPVT
jgi:hypothetical protein